MRTPKQELEKKLKKEVVNHFCSPSYKVTDTHKDYKHVRGVEVRANENLDYGFVEINYTNGESDQLCVMRHESILSQIRIL